MSMEGGKMKRIGALPEEWEILWKLSEKMTLTFDYESEESALISKYGIVYAKNR
jgi:hypothetical protein